MHIWNFKKWRLVRLKHIKNNYQTFAFDSVDCLQYFICIFTFHIFQKYFVDKKLFYKGDLYVRVFLFELIIVKYTGDAFE